MEVRNALKFFFVGLIAGWCVSASSQVANQPPVPQWIGHSAGLSNQPAFFRKSFQARLPLLKSVLLGACDGRMSIYLNGRSVAEITGPDRATSLDVTKYIREGQNVVAIRAQNPAGVARFSLLLELNGDLARKAWVCSDPSWSTTLTEVEDWWKLECRTSAWMAARSGGRVDATPEANPFDAKKAFDAYDSWKLALGVHVATDPATITLLRGFKAELVRSAQPEEGSWISMAFDPQGRLTLAREKRGLIRLSKPLTPTGGEVEIIEDTLLECRGLLYAHDALYVNANNSKGFYRLRDTNGDGRFDEVKLLLRTGGSVGHGRNHVVAGPDGSIYLVHGNNVKLAESVTANSPLAHYQNDALIPCPFDDALFDGDVTLPAGHILRMDPKEQRFELFAGGFRNPLDIAFNHDGEMFTFDADMEWDVGSPWYRPNRVNHVISGADFGWRRGTAKWPDYLPDTVMSTVDIGLASPTGIEFGYASRFAPPYNQALFMADWAYGRILAVHSRPSGASYTGKAELFASGRPLNVTDLTFGPDGAMYFITGGRGTQSGLYRISYIGPPVEATAKTRSELRQEAAASAARALRRRLETLHTATAGSKRAVDFIWPHLGHSDPWIRHAARVALEHQDLQLWQARALAESRTGIALTACLALARVGEQQIQLPLLERLNQLLRPKLSEAQELQALRVLEVVCARMGRPSPELATAIRAKLDSLYPSHDWHLNHRLCPLLVYFQSPSVTTKTLELLAHGERPEDFMQYLFSLRGTDGNWTLSQREAYFCALDVAEQKPGARDYYSVLKRVRDEVTARLTPREREALKPMLTGREKTLQLNTNTSPDRFVREWRMEDFNSNEPLRARSFANGKAAFTKAQCIVCHRFGNEGGVIGPDLTGVGSRFDGRALLESILEPSKVIDEKFRNTIFTMKNGSTLTGTVEREDEQKVIVREGPFTSQPAELLKANITGREPSPISPMPAGLINVLGREDILDLIAFLRSGGSGDDAAFKR